MYHISLTRTPSCSGWRPRRDAHPTPAACCPSSWLAGATRPGSRLRPQQAWCQHSARIAQRCKGREKRHSRTVQQGMAQRGTNKYQYSQQLVAESCLPQHSRQQLARQSATKGTKGARMPVTVSPWPSSVRLTSSFRRSHTLMVLSMPPVYTCRRDTNSVTTCWQKPPGRFAPKAAARPSATRLQLMWFTKQGIW